MPYDSLAPSRSVVWGRLVLAATMVAAAFVAWRFEWTPRARAEPTRSASAVAAPLLPVAAPPVSAVETSNTVSDVAERAVQSVVNISTTRIARPRDFDSGMSPFFGPFGPHGGMGREHAENSLGSGVIVGDGGIILTNNHVVEQASTIRVKLVDGREFGAKLVGADPRSDVAVLRLDGKVSGLRALALADSERLRLGETVLAIGSPFGMSQTVTMGIVSAKGRSDLGINDYEDFIQTDAAINPGNSGGALVNLRGELVGINTAILSRSGGSQGIGFAIPTNLAKPIMEGLLRDGRVSRGWLGVGIQDLDAELREAFGAGQRGVLITEVQQNSPAQKAGLRRGDVLTRIDDQSIDSTGHLRNAVAAHVAGTKVTIEVLRDKKPVQLEVTLTKAADPRDPSLAADGKEAPILGGLSVLPLDARLRERLEVPDDVRSGVVVSEVAPEGAAARAGLQRGDVILEVNRQPVSDPASFGQAVQASGSRLLLLVLRDGRARFVLLAK